MADTNAQISVLMKQAKRDLVKEDLVVNEIPDIQTTKVAVSKNHAVSGSVIVNFDAIIYNAIFQKFNQNNF